MPRSARLDCPGALHHIIGRGIEKRIIVKDDADREAFVDRLNRIAVETETPILAWALMSNHFHLLILSGPQGLSGFMRRLLSSYAQYYNKRHKRHGHLFQNRYKSIICDQDSYLCELVRYIHLNPIRAKMVKTLHQLSKYKWTGHATLLGNRQLACQETDMVLHYFGKRARSAREKYVKYVSEGISLGAQPHLVGGGLVRSLGGWSEVKSLRKEVSRIHHDDRILGNSDFVENLLKKADKQWALRQSVSKSIRSANRHIDKACKANNITREELTGGGRRRPLPDIRKALVKLLVVDVGLPLAEAGRLLGVSTSGVAMILRKCSY